MSKEITLPCYDIHITLPDANPGQPSCSSIKHADLYRADDMCLDKDCNCEFHGVIDGIMDLVLACACAGVDVESPEFVSAIECAIEGAGETATS